MIFGSNGSGISYAFDYQRSDTPVVAFYDEDMSRGATSVVVANFDEFLFKLARGGIRNGQVTGLKAKEKMTLPEMIDIFEGAVGRAAAVAPDEYPAFSYDNYEQTRADIEELWPKIRAEMNLEEETKKFVDAKLDEAFSLFASGGKLKARDAMWDIYNLRLGERQVTASS
jgi:hypothetical protein